MTIVCTVRDRYAHRHSCVHIDRNYIYTAIRQVTVSVAYSQSHVCTQIRMYVSNRFLCHLDDATLDAKAVTFMIFYDCHVR